MKEGQRSRNAGSAEFHSASLRQNLEGSIFPHPCRLQVGDIAEYNPALRGRLRHVACSGAAPVLDWKQETPHVRLTGGRRRYVVLRNFDEFWIHDFDSDPNGPKGRVAFLGPCAPNACN